MYRCLSLYRTPSTPNLWIYQTVLPGYGIHIRDGAVFSILNLWIYRTILQGTDGFGIARENCNADRTLYVEALRVLKQFLAVRIGAIALLD